MLEGRESLKEGKVLGTKSSHGPRNFDSNIVFSIVFVSKETRKLLDDVPRNFTSSILQLSGNDPFCSWGVGSFKTNLPMPKNNTGGDPAARWQNP